jgi:hypothetical protein
LCLTTFSTAWEKKKLAKKVKYSPWEFSPTLFEDKPKSHEGKYVIIETTMGAKLTEMSVFTAETIIRHIAPNYVSADKMRETCTNHHRSQRNLPGEGH